MDDKLKDLSNITTADSRCDYMVGDLAEFHNALKHCELSESAPEVIRRNFATALNTMLYSWYFYPMSTPALLYAFTTLELALKEKYPASNNEGLSKMLRKARDEGLISDDIFPNRQTGKSMAFIESMPKLRNSFAHGTQFLMEKWPLVDIFESVAIVINNLFKPA